MKRTYKRKLRFLSILSVIAILAVGLTACDDSSTTKSKDNTRDTASYSAVSKSANSNESKVYTPKNNVEFENYNKAQKLYDDPNAILWCTTSWGIGTPLITVPIKGKLTSSSVSYFPGQSVQRNTTTSDSFSLTENRSVDGMYHGNPPSYRYGFSPTGQYMEFYEQGTFCTTALISFQKEQTIITYGDGDKEAIEKIESEKK